MKRIQLLFFVVMVFSAGGAAANEPNATFNSSAPTGMAVLYTRVRPGPQIPEPVVEFVPYDPVTKRIEGRGLDLPGRPFRVGRGAGMWSNARNQRWEGWVVSIEPGIYIVARATNPNSGGRSNTFSRGSLMFEIGAGQAVYLGDYSFYLDNYRSPTVGRIAGGFLRSFFSLGLLTPDQEFFGADVTYDEARASVVCRSRVRRRCVGSSSHPLR